MPSKDKISAGSWEKILIGSEMCVKYGLPAKAVGLWAIIRNDGWKYWLRKVRRDGFLMSSKGNNHQSISVRIFEKILAEISEQNTKENSEKEYRKMLANLSVRKMRWLDMLVAKMKADAEFSVMFEILGEVEIRRMVIADTDANREGGKLYSSVATALEVWLKRNNENAEVAKAKMNVFEAEKSFDEKKNNNEIFCAK